MAFTFARCSQTKMKPRILRRLVAHAAFALVIECQISGHDLHPRPHTVTIRPRPDQRNLQPVIGIAAVVAQQLGRLAVVVHQDVQVAIIVEIADRRAPAHARQLEVGAQLGADIFKDAFARYCGTSASVRRSAPRSGSARCCRGRARWP